MTIIFPASQREVFNRVSADILNELPGSGPFLKNSFVMALSVGYSARLYDNYQLLGQILQQMFPDTATGEFLVRWGSYVNCFKHPSTGSSGDITVVGLINNSVPADSVFQTQEGITYTATAASSVGLQTINVSSLTRSGSTVTVTTAGDHILATGMYVNITGANQAAYNGEFPITVTDSDEFNYTLPSAATPTTPATGTITTFFYGAAVSVDSDANGLSSNLDPGTALNLVTPLTGINQNAYVQWGGVVGGTDQESDDDYRIRVLDRYQNPVALFNKAAIESQCKDVPGVTRVFVNECTPYVGAVTVYFTRDNDTNNIPTSEHVNQVKNALLEIKPATTDSVDVIVLAPTAVPVNFTFTSISPNTVTMQAAITASLQEFFKESTVVSEDLLQAGYQSAIYQTVDLQSGSILNGFLLSSPSTNISIDAGELPTLGTITFS